MLRIRKDDYRPAKVTDVTTMSALGFCVDLPDVDTLSFLRPTESAALFLQQLGRGLRRTQQKTCCTVLDFIGNAHRKFRFDTRLRAILGGTRKGIARQVSQLR